MKKHKHYLLVFFLLCFLSNQLPAQERIKAGILTTIEKDYPDSQVDGYLLYLPKSYDQSKKRYPLLMFLQGSLAVGGEVSSIAMGEIPKMLKDETDMNNPLNQLLLDSFIVVCPHIRDGQYFEQEPAFRSILQELQETYRIDSDRISLTGLSRGGMGSWGLAETMSDVFAAVAPMAGGVWMVDDFSKMKEVSFWVAHANQDPSLVFPPVKEAVEKIEALTEEKFFRLNTPKPFTEEYLEHKRIFNIFDRDIHNVWDDVYESLQFYRWLLRQRKNGI